MTRSVQVCIRFSHSSVLAMQTGFQGQHLQALPSMCVPPPLSNRNSNDITGYRLVRLQNTQCGQSSPQPESKIQSPNILITIGDYTHIHVYIHMCFETESTTSRFPKGCELLISHFMVCLMLKSKLCHSYCAKRFSVIFSE